MSSISFHVLLHNVSISVFSSLSFMVVPFGVKDVSREWTPPSCRILQTDIISVPEMIRYVKS